jgi:hypothetical protein
MRSTRTLWVAVGAAAAAIALVGSTFAEALAEAVASGQLTQA